MMQHQIWHKTEGFRPLFFCALMNITTYSTTEKVAGTWIDGSTLYMRVFKWTRTDSSSIALPFDYTKIKRAEVYTLGKNGAFSPMYYQSSTDRFRWWIHPQLNFSVGGSYPEYPITLWAIFWYTH